MDTALIKVGVHHDFPPKFEAQSLLIANGINRTQPSFQIADIDMAVTNSLTYTSLKDLLPASPPGSFAFPAYNRRDSWREIPIKDPLLQHAAWAYLQPLSAARESDDRSCFPKLEDGWRRLSGCFGWFFDDVVWGPIWKLFSKNDDAD